MMLGEVQIRFLRIEDIKLLGHLHFPWTTKEKTIEKWQRYLAEQDTQKRVVCIVECFGTSNSFGNFLKKGVLTNSVDR